MNDARRDLSSQHRLSAYRPVLDRLILTCSLLGVLVVVHLGVQQGRGFEGGCLGVATLSAPSSGAAATSASGAIDCHSVVNSEAGTFLGVSNILLGFVFYMTLTGMGLAVAYTQGLWRGRLKRLRATIVVGGFLYTLYLLYYQSFVIERYCTLCLLSAALVTVLFALHLTDFFTDSTTNSMDSSTSNRRYGREVALQSVAALLVFLLAGADVMYFNEADRSSQPQSASAQSSATAEEPVSASRSCKYNKKSEPVEDFDSLVQFTDPVQGNPNAPVTMIEYIDPTCPHCKTLHSYMGQVIAAKKEKARFVYKMFPLRRASFPPILALQAAADQGKFFEMLDRQFATQRQGFSLKRLRSMASELGMDPNEMEQTMRSKKLVQDIIKQRKRATDIGVDSTPTVFINGRMVGRKSRSPSCLKKLIDRAAAQEG